MKNWQHKKLGDVATFSQGIQVGLEKHETTPKEGYVRFIRIVDYTQNTNDIRYVPDPGTKYLVNEDDIVMVRYGTPGLIGRGKAGVLANNLFRIKIDDKDLSNDYLCLYLSQDKIQNYLSTQGSSTMPALNFGQLRTVEIKFPSLTEQQGIVSTLVEVFATIAKAKSNAEQNLQNTTELFESYKNALFDNNGDGYDEIALKEVCDKITQGPNPKYDKNENENFRVLKTKNLYDKNILYDEADRVSESVFNTCLSSELKGGDVLLAIVGQGSINKCNVFEDKTPFRFIYTRALGLIRTNKAKLNPYYLRAFLQSKKGKDLIDFGIGGTSGQQVVTTTYIKALKIPLPPLNIQQIIVKKLDTLSTETQKLEAIYQQKINDLEELKKSILQKAFSGELKIEKEVMV